MKDIKTKKPCKLISRQQFNFQSIYLGNKLKYKAHVLCSFRKYWN